MRFAARWANSPSRVSHGLSGVSGIGRGRIGHCMGGRRRSPAFCVLEVCKERLDAARGHGMMPTMSELPSIEMPETLGVIAGLGTYPWQLARSAHAQGVKRVVAFAFKGETEWAIKKYADEVVWLNLGQLGALLEAVKTAGVTQLVMAGQIKPTRVFSLRLDAKALSILRQLKKKNAHTIFGAVADELKAAGFTVVGSQEVLYVPDSSELDTAFAAGKSMAERITK